MLKNTLILAVLMVLQAANPLLAEAGDWKVTYDQAKCLVDNADNFLASEANDPLIIVIAVCPIVDPAEALEQFTVNSTSPSIAVIPEAEQGKMDSVIIYTRVELTCLVKFGIGDQNDPMELPREPCQ